MQKFFLMSGSISAIITAKTADAAKLLFEISYPGINPSMCIKMAQK